MGRKAKRGMKMPIIPDEGIVFKISSETNYSFSVSNNFQSTVAKKGVRDRDAEKAAQADCASSSDGEEGDTAGTTLPMANLVRLMRQVIPKGIKVASSAKHLTHDCAVEFVGFVAGEASEHAKVQHRRIIAPEDFTCAFQSLGLDDYVQPMSTYIRRYREHHNAYGRIVTACPPSDAAAKATVTAASGVPCSSNEEMQYMRSMVPPPCEEHRDDQISSASPEGHTGCM